MSKLGLRSVGVPGRHIRQWTAHAIHHQHRHLAQHDNREHQGKMQPSGERHDRDGHDAKGHERPTRSYGRPSRARARYAV